MNNNTLARVTKVYNGKDEKQRRAEAEAMLALKIQGHSVPSIAERYNVSGETVRRRIDAALDRRLAPTVDRYREQQNAALDESIRQLNEQIDAVTRLIVKQSEENPPLVQHTIPDLMDKRAKYIEARGRFFERQAKLNGLDRPIQVDVTVTETTQDDLAMRDLIGEAKARAATGRVDDPR